MSAFKLFNLAQAAEARGSYRSAMAHYLAAGAPKSVSRMRSRIEAMLS